MHTKLAPEWSSAREALLSDRKAVNVNKFNEDRQRVRQLAHSIAENRQHVSIMRRNVGVKVVHYKDHLTARPRLMPRWIWQSLRTLGRIRVASIQRMEVICLKGTYDVVILPKSDHNPEDKVLIWRLKARYFEPFNWERGSSYEFDLVRQAINAGPALVVTALNLPPHR